MEDGVGGYAHSVHSAEFTNTVRSAGAIPYTSSIRSGLKAKGAWYCTWLSIVKLCSTESCVKIGDMCPDHICESYRGKAASHSLDIASEIAQWLIEAPAAASSLSNVKDRR